MEKIPVEVLIALEDVRSSGTTNMLDRRDVIALITVAKYNIASDWLTDNEERYTEALNAMGARRSAEEIKE